MHNTDLISKQFQSRVYDTARDLNTEFADMKESLIF